MHWRQKALLQRLIARLPQRMSEQIYYRLQRAAGAFQSIEPWDHLAAARDVAQAAARHGVLMDGAEILEVGTGHRVLLPVAFWLLGAQRVTTVDVHRYIKSELVELDLQQMALDPDRVDALLSFPQGNVRPDRLAFLCKKAPKDLNLFFEDLGIEYRAPADAGALHDSDMTYDLHISRSVLEHVPPHELARIFVEAGRVLRGSGLFVHLVDFSDHFAHIDSFISSTNFLQFSDEEWAHLSGNQFAYHNRLRSDDFEELFQKSGLRLIEARLALDEGSLRELQGGFRVDQKFQGHDPVRLAQREGLFTLTRKDRRRKSAERRAEV